MVDVHQQEGMKEEWGLGPISQAFPNLAKQFPQAGPRVQTSEPRGSVTPSRYNKRGPSVPKLKDRESRQVRWLRGLERMESDPRTHTLRGELSPTSYPLYVCKGHRVAWA